MRVIVDTNVVISGIFWSGPPQKILDLWLRGNISLLVSIPILSEYRETLRRMTGEHGFDIFEKWNRLLTEYSEIILEQKLGQICRDSDDEKFLEAAVGGKAAALISGDRDLLSLKEIRGIPILSPRTFINNL